MPRAPSTPEEIAERRKRLIDAVGPAQVREMQRRRARETVPGSFEEGRLSFERAVELERRGVSFAIDHRGALKRAHKGDIFHRLANRSAITTRQHAAVRRLENDMHLRAGIAPREGERVVVDGSRDFQGLTDAQADAGDRVVQVLGMVGPPACRVLSALLDPFVHQGREIDWRDAVEQITGEKRAEVQAALVRFAAEAAADVYDAIDKARRGA